MKTTIELPDRLLIEAKKHAAEHRITLRALIEQGLRHELEGAAPDRVRRPRIKWVTVPGRLAEGLDVSDRGKMMERLIRDRAGH